MKDFFLYYSIALDSNQDVIHTKQTAVFMNIVVPDLTVWHYEDL